MFIRAASMFSRLVAATLCVGITLSGCTQAPPTPDDRSVPAPLVLDGDQALPSYDYTVDDSPGELHVFTARERDTGLAVATMSVDERGKVIAFQRGEDRLDLAFHQDTAGYLVVAGEANGAPFTFAMLPGDFRSMTVTGDSPEVARIFKQMHEAFPDIDSLQGVAAVSWWNCALCAGALVALGLSIAILWPLIPALVALIAEYGLAALGALTGAELAHLLGCSIALAVLILGDCWECVKSMIAENPKGEVAADAVEDAPVVRVDQPIAVPVPVE